MDIISGDEDMSDGEENTAPPVEAAAPQNPPAEPVTQPAHHPTSGSKDIRMHAFTADPDPDESGSPWKKWKNELLTRFRYSRISNIQDRVDAFHIYGGERIGELIESLKDVPLASPQPQVSKMNSTKLLPNWTIVLSLWSTPIVPAAN